VTIETTFLSRLKAQWKHSPHILKLINILSDVIQDQDDAITFLVSDAATNYLEAEGEQLDFLYSLIGGKRPMKQETRLFTLYRLGEVADPEKGFADTSDPDVTVGGYIGTDEGLVDQDDPTAQMSDVDLRAMIAQKAATLYTRMTRENLYNYLLAFGARSKIDDDTRQEVTCEAIRYDDLNDWQRWYVEARGMKPHGIVVQMAERFRNKESV
jgi:hypothetical protein